MATDKVKVLLPNGSWLWLTSAGFGREPMLWVFPGKADPCTPAVPQQPIRGGTGGRGSEGQPLATQLWPTTFGHQPAARSLTHMHAHTYTHIHTHTHAHTNIPGMIQLKSPFSTLCTNREYEQSSTLYHTPASTVQFPPAYCRVGHPVWIELN